MADRSFLDWPFFEDRHRALATELDSWTRRRLTGIDHADTDATCRALVVELGEAGWLMPTGAANGERLDLRTLCLIRETLARHDGLADFAFAMQGLGTGAISLFGTDAQRAGWLRLTRGQGDCGLRADRTAIRLGRCRLDHDRPARPRGLCAARREDLDLQRWDRRCLRSVRAQRRGARCEGAFGVHRTGGPAGLRGGRTAAYIPSPRIRWRGCASPIAACPQPRCSASRGRGSASRCRFPTSFARPWRRRRLAFPAAPLTRPLPASRPAMCGVPRYPIFRWCRGMLRTWRWGSMRPRR